MSSITIFIEFCAIYLVFAYVFVIFSHMIINDKDNFCRRWTRRMRIYTLFAPIVFPFYILYGLSVLVKWAFSK